MGTEVRLVPFAAQFERFKHASRSLIDRRRALRSR
jgi:hypothetical protein